MTRAHPAAAEPAKLPTPRRPVRHNEWTRAKMVGFLRELAASQSVQQAARSVGMSRQAAYKLRNRLAGTPFALAWEVALEAGLQQLAHAVLDRAVNGEEVPHYYHGELVGTHRKHDNRLAAWLLDNPWKVGRQQVAREFSAEGWDRLLERIEWANLDWEAGEGLPGKDPPPPPIDDDELDAELLAPEGESAEEREERRLKLYAERCGEQQDRFVGQRSWYAARAEEELARGPRGGARR